MLTLDKSRNDLNGKPIDLRSLDSEEIELVEKLDQFALSHPNALTGEFWNYSIASIADFYEKRGLSRGEITQTIPWRIGQDLNNRLMIAAGLARRSGYRDQLEALVVSKFGSRREFCKATGISEDMLSHVLAKRKNMGIETLSDALARIGYTITIAPIAESTQPL